LGPKEAMNNILQTKNRRIISEGLNKKVDILQGPKTYLTL